MTANQHRIYGIVSGACFIAITQLATREHLEAIHLFSLCCFAASLPFMALGGAVAEIDHVAKTSFLERLIDQLIGDSLFVFWVGIVALLFSFGWLVALLFVVSSLIALTIAKVSASRQHFGG